MERCGASQRGCLKLGAGIVIRARGSRCSASFTFQRARRPLCQAILQSTLLPSATLAALYRFAVLLAGSAKSAERVMAAVLTDAKAECEQLRNETTRRAWLVSQIRERCAGEAAATPAPGLVRGGGHGGESPELLKIEAFLLAQRVHALPEPDRTALALFYLDLFGIEEIAAILKMSLHELAATLERGRALLRESLKSMREEAAATR